MLNNIPPLCMSYDLCRVKAAVLRHDVMLAIVREALPVEYQCVCGK